MYFSPTKDNHFSHHHRYTDVTNNSNTTAMINEEPCMVDGRIIKR